MLFTSSAAALMLATFASAAPMAAPSPSTFATSYTAPPASSTYTPTSSTYTPSASYTAPEQSNTPTANIIRPSTLSQYDVWTGAVHYKSAEGKIFKDGHSTDVTTLLTFTFPAASAGKTCSFHFNPSADPAATVSGTAQFDVYTSQAPATANSASWPSGNLRDHHLGRMTAKSKGEATWVDGFPKFGQAFPCPAGETYGAELVGAGDIDHIQWLASADVAYISY
jgi:hypothetical protein